MGRSFSSHGMNFLQLSHGMGLSSKICVPWDGIENFKDSPIPWDKHQIFFSSRGMGWDRMVQMGWDGTVPWDVTLVKYLLKKYSFLIHLLVELTLSVIKLFHVYFLIVINKFTVLSSTFTMKKHKHRLSFL